MTDEPHSSEPQLGDEGLSALYRQIAHEAPPPHQDAMILAAAAKELSATSRAARPTGWSRWRVGLSLVMTLVLSAGLVMLVDREQSPHTPASAPPAMNAAPSPSAPSRELDRRDSPLAAPKSFEQRSGPRQDALESEAAAGGNLAPAAKAKAPSASSSALENAPAPSQEPAPRPLEARIEEIRTLLNTGREAEARAALKALLMQHPDQLLPPDLEPLRPKQ